MRYLLLFAILILLSASAKAAPSALSMKQPHWRAPAVAATLDLQDNRDGQQQLLLKMSGQRLLLRLRQNTALAAQLPAHKRSQIELLRGEIDGISASWVRLNKLEGRWSGVFYDGDTLYAIDDYARRGDRADSRWLAVRKVSDLSFGLPHDIDDGGLVVPAHERKDDWLYQLRQHSKAVREVFPITLVTDREFNSRHSNAQAVALSRLNIVDGIYSNQLNQPLYLLDYAGLSQDNGMTSTKSGDLLGEFVTFMRNNNTIERAGTTHLFSGKNFDGGTVGVAYLGVLCSNNYGFGINQDLSGNTTSALVFAHELGHNFGAGHDNDTDSCPSGTFRGIMNSSINGSQQFSQCSVDAMSAELARASCLLTIGNENDIFVDSFDG